MKKISIVLLTLISLSSFSSDNDDTVIGPNDKLPCGLQGSVDERIQDCSYSEIEGFVLVTRSKDFKEVHKEVSTGLLWSDRLTSNMNQYFSHRDPRTSTMNHYEAGKACNSILPEFAGIEGKTWRLPSIDEYIEAEKNGIRKALPNMNYWFWSSSLPPFFWPNYSWTFNGVHGYTSHLSRNDHGNHYFSVRCVAR